jgi:hypothetical protein
MPYKITLVGIIANASGLLFAGLQSASTANVVFVPSETQRAVGVAASADTVVNPGPVEVSATVSVTYRVG